LIGGGTWAALDNDKDRRTGSATAPIASSPTASTAPTVSPTPSSTPSSSAGTWAAPIYYLGRNVTGLFREFHPLPVTPGSVVSHVADAFRVALDPESPNRPGVDQAPWLVGTSGSFRLAMTGGDTLVLTLPDSEKTSMGATKRQAQLAAQQLVWTATAVAQDARLGLRITFAHGTGRLFGVLPVDQTFHRPPAALAYQDLAAIWVLAPSQGATVHGTVTFSGQACTFEANVAWQVLPGPSGSGAVVRSGRTTASSGCPQRGTWSVTVAGLPPGTYTFRAYELSAKGDGSYEGLDTTTFVVS
jgi:hypothetical protein